MSDLPNIPSDRITEELQKLYQLFQSGALTDDEYAKVKAKILEAAVQASPTLESLNTEAQIQLLRVEMENALLRVEQDWSYERESHLRYYKSGSPHEPSEDDAALIVILGIVTIVALFLMLISAD